MTLRYDDSLSNEPNFFSSRQTYKQMLEKSNSISINWLGIDVSKDNLVIASRIAHTKDFKVIRILNQPQAISTWIKTLSAGDACILEYTGTYSSTLSYLLHQHEVRQSIVTPDQSKSFAGVLKSITKNDDRDATHLLLFGERHEPEFYNFANDNILKIRQLRAAIRQQNKALRVIQNQLHAFEQLPYQQTIVVEMYKGQIKQLQANIQQLQDEIGIIADDKFKALDDKIQTVVGIGPKTSHAIISATNGFEGFNHVNQVAKFAGVAPKQESSGNYKAKSKINKNGNTELRSALYMAALSALRFNKACSELYIRLRAKGKPRKQALIAVAHKLIKQIWGVVKSGLDFDNDFHVKKQNV
jgi:transposase